MSMETIYEMDVESLDVPAEEHDVTVNELGLRFDKEGINSPPEECDVIRLENTSKHDEDGLYHSDGRDSNCVTRNDDVDDDVSASSTDTANDEVEEDDDDMAEVSSQGYDTDDDLDHHFFIDHHKVKDEMDNARGRRDDHRIDHLERAVVLELEPLRQPANERRCQDTGNYKTINDVNGDGKPDDDVDDRDGDGDPTKDPSDQKKNGTRIFLAVKSAYFLLFSGHVSFFPFIPVYLSYLGLDVMEIGKIRALEPFIGMVATPLCGTVADRFSRHKLMLLACLCGTAMVYGSSVFLPFLSPASSSHMNSIHTEPNVTNSTSDIGQMVFGGFFRRHPHMIAAMDSCNISYLSYSDLQESIEENSCNFTNTKRRHGSTVTVYLEDMHGCSFTKLPLESPSVFKENSGGVAPDVRCLFCEGMMRVCTFQYQMTECQNRSINCNDSFGDSTPVSINDTTHFINGGMSLKEKDLLGVFVIMLVILIVGEMFAYSSVPLLDASTMTLIDEYKERGQTFEYGRQRMWGGIAHGVLAPLSGIAVDAYAAGHPNAFNKYLPAFVLFVSFLVLCAATASVIPIRAKPRTTESFAKNAKSFLLTPKVILFFVIMFITGILLGCINTYLFLFLAEINGGATIMGLTLTGACAAEVPFMMFSSKLIDKIGHRGVIGIALFAFVLRFVGYSLLQNPWAVIPIELLHGVTYGSMWPACTSYIHLISPPDMAATMQSLTYSIRGGLGKGIGTIIGGVIYHNYGARNLFRGSAILSLVTLVMYFIISLILDKREKSTGYDKL